MLRKSDKQSHGSTRSVILGAILLGVTLTGCGDDQPDPSTTPFDFQLVIDYPTEHDDGSCNMGIGHEVLIRDAQGNLLASQPILSGWVEKEPYRCQDDMTFPALPAVPSYRLEIAGALEEVTQTEAREGVLIHLNGK